MLTGDATSTEMCFQVEQAILALAPCMRARSLDRDSRRHLLFTVDILTSVWRTLHVDGEIPAGRASTLQALFALCEMTAACEDEEKPLALRAIYRIVEGWTLSQETVSSSAAPSQGAAEEPVKTETPMEQVPATATVESEGQMASVTETPPAPSSITEPAAEPPESQAEEKVSEPVDSRAEEARNRLSERLEALASQLERVESHALAPEEAVPLLLACACRYRLVQPEAAMYGREWDVSQLKRQLTMLAKERFRNLWLPPLDPGIDFSEHELETLHTGYEALSRSWQMWRWYEQHRADMDKGVGVPLLESIAAPVPMVQQIWTSKQLLSRVAEQDGADTLREAVQEEARARKWELDMLAANSSRQRQSHFVKHADEHWEAAKRYVQKRAHQREAIAHLQTVLSAPNPDTFEDDLLCALVACHQAQIPYSNKQLCDLISGYHFLLENPAVPEQCALTKSEQSSARKFLVNLGKQLLKNEQKEAPQEQQSEEEPQSEHNGDLLRKARKITQGKKLFMLCFNRRAEAEQHIREALQFAEVDWPDLDGGESVNSMEARIRNADMTVVVVRYSRTHWKEARDIAKQYGKQFVMATKGYGVTHLAQQIVEQCGKG
ncbi:MAG: hypothetical protein ACP5RN_06095 [Armatimonadota bacterium]